MIKLKDLLTERKVKVPNKGIFPNKEKAINFIKNLEQDDTPVYNIVDGETGEIFMEPGQTKRKQEKQWKKYEKNMYKLIYGDEEEFVYDSRYDVIDNFYTILRKDLDHGMSKKEKEKMRQADYDLSYNVPVKISRKDLILLYNYLTLNLKNIIIINVFLKILDFKYMQKKGRRWLILKLYLLRLE